jgi:hypothetical protein
MRTALVLLAILPALLLGCGGDDGPSDTATLPSPQELISSSTAAMQDVKSFHFRLGHENGATPMPLNLQLVSAEGDVTVPDKLKASVKARAALSVSVSVDVIGIGDQTWITNPFTRRWETLPGAQVSDIADPTRLLLDVLGAMTGAEVAAAGGVDDTQTLKLTGSIDSGLLRPALDVARPGRQVRIEIWLGREDKLPRRLKLIGPIAASEEADIVRQLDLSRYNASVDIRPPQ